MGVLRRAALATILLLGIHLALAGPVEEIGGGEGQGMIRSVSKADTITIALCGNGIKANIEAAYGSSIDVLYADSSYFADAFVNIGSADTTRTTTYYLSRTDEDGTNMFFDDPVVMIPLLWFNIEGISGLSGKKIVEAKLVLWKSPYSNANRCPTTADTMYVVPNNKSDMYWPQHGYQRTNRIYLCNSGPTISWPTRHGQTNIQNYYFPADITDYMFADFPYMIGTGNPWVAGSQTFDLAPVVQNIVGGDINSGFWLISHATVGSVADDREEWTFKSLSNDDGAYSPALIIKYTTENYAYRWWGRDWVACFTTDDGLLYNNDWADVADSLNFKITVGINSGHLQGGTDPYTGTLSGPGVLSLYNRGMEIANHAYSHGKYGMSYPCDAYVACDIAGQLTSGNMVGYFSSDCYDGVDITDWATAHAAFIAEISRDSLADFTTVPVSAITSFNYPGHQHSDSVFYYLSKKGYIGARDGTKYTDSCFPTAARPLNDWYQGFSLYRLPYLLSSATLFLDHSAGAGVYWLNKTNFYARCDSVLAAQEVSSRGKIFMLYDHHFGDNDDRYGDVNYGAGGVTEQDLAWFHDWVTSRGGAFKPLGEIIRYIRARKDSVTAVTTDYGADYAGDLIWR